jgi:hypothetical protein
LGLLVVFNTQGVVAGHQSPLLKWNIHLFYTFQTLPPLDGECVQEMILLEELPVGPLQVQRLHLRQLTLREVVQQVGLELVVAVEGQRLQLLVASE